MRLIQENNKFTVTDLVKENRYEYVSLTRNDNDGPRTYNVGMFKVPSVTTILSATQSKEKKASLDAWRARVGYQEAQAITNKADLIITPETSSLMSADKKNLFKYSYEMKHDPIIKKVKIKMTKNNFATIIFKNKIYIFISKNIYMRHQIAYCFVFFVSFFLFRGSRKWSLTTPSAT